MGQHVKPVMWGTCALLLLIRFEEVMTVVFKYLTACHIRLDSVASKGRAKSSGASGMEVDLGINKKNMFQQLEQPHN